MNDTKAELVDTIMAKQCGERDIARTAKGVTPMIAMMIHMADGKEEDIPVFARRLAERIIPLIKEVARETYIEKYTLEQLEALASFHQNNPWFHDMAAQLDESLNAVAANRAGPLMRELFDEYIPAED